LQQQPVRNLKRQIIAMGGGGFSAEPENPLLDLYILKQARSSNPSVCFIPTASGDSESYIAKFYAAYCKLKCRPRHLTFFQRTPDLHELILGQDVVYVGGGNTKSMLAVWQEWGLPRILRQAWNAGVVLAGISAGAICWFESGVTDSWAGRLAPLKCLGLLPGTCCPHYDGEKDRRPSLHKLLAVHALPPAIALDDGAAAHYVGRKLLRVVCSRPSALGYRVQLRHGGRVTEKVLPVVRLEGRNLR
jgi:peptidase E